MTYNNGVAAVDWNRTESGIHQLKSKVINHFLTRLGTDKIAAGRGTELDARLMGLGAFDAVGIQHELNFAVIRVFRSVREFNADRAEAAIASFRAVFAGYSEGRAAVRLQVTNAAGDTVGTTTDV